MVYDMVPFHVSCPKCGSSRVSLTRDRRARWGAHTDGQPVLGCANCGKTLYGDAATEEVARQQEKWDGQHATRLAKQLASAALHARRTSPAPIVPSTTRFLGLAPVAEITVEDLRAKLQSESNLVVLHPARPAGPAATTGSPRRR
jgi:hypothetical protein